jgi:hypothetical protein
MLRFFLSVISFIYTVSLQKQCPKISCTQGSSNTCASINTHLPDLGYNIVNLMDVCLASEFCDIYPIPPWKAFTDLDRNKTYTCSPKNITISSRFPGEDCDDDGDCVQFGNTTGKCTGNKCIGQKQNDTCSATAECLTGLYCNKSDQKCEPQRQMNASCNNSFDCVNSLLCFNKICSIKPFSLPIGQEVPDTSDPFSDFYCSLSRMRNTGNSTFCTLLNQTTTGDDLVKCNYGDSCSYLFDNSDKASLDCECGYNANGQGYCPIGHTQSKINN